MDSIVLTSKMLHDIRNSLNTILGYSQIFQDEDDFCEDQRKMAISMEKAATKIINLLSSKKKEIVEDATQKNSLLKEIDKRSLGSKIVIIDDREENLSLFRDILSPYNYDIQVALNGKDGLDIINNFEPELILLDVVMPKMDGYEVLKELKQNKLTKDIPVIFLTAKDTAEDIVKGLEEGATDYLAKPCHPKELIARVQTHLQKARLFANLKRLMEESFHELYTPLSIISSAMQMQELEYEKTNYTQMSLAACKTLQNIYDDLYYSISYSNKIREKSIFDFSMILNQRVQYFTLAAQSRSLRFNINIPQQMPVLLNQEEMERILDNLISNSIKYTKENDEIVISITKKEDKWIFLICNKVSKEINISKIFQKYNRQQEEIFGLGIGLELVQSICKKSDISISAEMDSELFCMKMELPQIK
ncbi:response regulator [Sulfurimonas sp.]|uniref:response regulator n=1 Tax=Sulfurimonas sp. TaxID=2022749 RepID=UPI00260136F4|nr:response regulator [Sulfurimonas sp.]MCK9454697.1 response regulator [Sulfurimonas sp.]